MNLQLQQLFLLQQRARLDNYQKNIYLRLSKGYRGEMKMDQLFERHAEKVEYLDDLTLHFQGTTVQIDKLALSKDTVQIFDMKFYQGKYSFENGEWYYGNQLLAHNILEQLRQAVRLVKGVFTQAELDLKVVGILAFMNEAAEIIIQDEIAETILQHDQIASYLASLKPTKNWKWKKVLQPFMRPAINQPLTNIQLKNLKKGICCRHCHSLNTYESRYTLNCQDCGHKEPKQTAYNRTICEFGCLFPAEELKKGRLIEFFGKNVNISYLNRTLRKYFELIKNTGPTSAYVNKAVSFEEWFAADSNHFQTLEKRTQWRSL
ncbi:MAG TPA: nuclease-related domain-containing protein [Tetragenococcus sp.]|nr:nuclease-related domain-containing protein [Tetragenococcus sp.]